MNGNNRILSSIFHVILCLRALDRARNPGSDARRHDHEHGTAFGCGPHPPPGLRGVSLQSADRALASAAGAPVGARSGPRHPRRGPFHGAYHTISGTIAPDSRLRPGPIRPQSGVIGSDGRSDRCGHLHLEPSALGPFPSERSGRFFDHIARHRLTWPSPAPIPTGVSRLDGRSAPMPKGGRRGKSGLQGQTVPDNVRRASKLRDSATEKRPPWPRCVSAAARVKRCGKSAPRLRQRRRHGKPHREQNRIGTARERSRSVLISRSGRLHDAPGNRRTRGMAVTFVVKATGHTEPGLQVG